MGSYLPLVSTLGQQVLQNLTFSKAPWLLPFLRFYFYKLLIWQGAARPGSRPATNTTVCFNAMILGVGGSPPGFLLGSRWFAESATLGVSKLHHEGTAAGGQKVARSTTRPESAPWCLPHPTRAEPDEAYSPSVVSLSWEPRPGAPVGQIPGHKRETRPRHFLWRFLFSDPHTKQRSPRRWTPGKVQELSGF